MLTNFEDFYIDKDNYNTDFFYGYKINKYSGRWVKKEGNLITRSIIPIPIYIYKYNDFWAISSNIETFKKYNLHLTKNNNYKKVIYENYDEYNDKDKIEYNEISILQYLKNLKIEKKKLKEIDLENNLFTKKLDKSNIQYLDFWYESYYNTFHDNNYLFKLSLSCGFDSRLFLNMVDLNNIIIRNNEYKNPKCNQQGDYFVSDLLDSLNISSKLYETKKKKDLQKGIIRTWISSNLKDKKLPKVYTISGMGTEFIKCISQNKTIDNKKFHNIDWIKKFFMYLNCDDRTIRPYVDYLLLQFDAKPYEIQSILYNRYGKNLLNFPFYSFLNNNTKLNIEDLLIYKYESYL